MAEQQLIERLRADLYESLRAEHLAEGVLGFEDVKRIAGLWLVIAEWNYDVNWWDFLPCGDSPEDACRVFALGWMTAHRPMRSHPRSRQANVFQDSASTPRG